VIACAAAAAGIVASAIPAFAHITITPGSASPGSAAVLTFHVPNEEATAYATRVDMRVPTDHPIAQLLVEPVAGWTISVRTITLAKPLVTDDAPPASAVPPASGATSAADGTARAIAVGGALIGLLGLALAGLCWRRAKALTARELPLPALNGDGPAVAGPQPAGAARSAPRRKGASARRATSRR